MNASIAKLQAILAQRESLKAESEALKKQREENKASRRKLRREAREIGEFFQCRSCNQQVFLAAEGYQPAPDTTFLPQTWALIFHPEGHGKNRIAHFCASCATKMIEKRGPRHDLMDWRGQRYDPLTGKGVEVAVLVTAAPTPTPTAESTSVAGEWSNRQDGLDEHGTYHRENDQLSKV